MSLTPHLRRLEAEAVFILREAVAEFRRPVMLYSIGKDSSVMLHLALKAFYPAKPPFPLLHVDTTWKFREMITFRDQTAARVEMDLIVHTNEDGRKRGVSPFTCSSSAYTQTMKTEALRQALNEGGFDAAFGGARRDEEKSRAKERIFSHRTASHGWDPKTLADFQHSSGSRRDHADLSAVELDRDRRLGLHRRRKHPGRASLSRKGTANRPPQRRLHHGR
ncbi:MAG: hypothetical protein FD172_3030 [Methylocystaceae bacterium]|nr:MAG: hypothetical protein FD172_3030 [Methylocystaceae bacterium]